MAKLDQLIRDIEANKAKLEAAGIEIRVKRETKKVTFDIPLDAHKAFLEICGREDLRIKDAAGEMIDDFVRKYSKA